MINQLIANQSILRDFYTFLEYIQRKDGIELTKTKQVPRAVDLLKLNEQVYFGAPFVTSKSQIKHYGLLNTFFQIVKVSELAIIQKDKSKFKLFIDHEKFAQLQTLSAVEHYFFLWESFWCYVNWDEAYDIRSFWDHNFYQSLAKEEVGTPVSVSERNIKRIGKLKPPLYTDIAEVFTAFGFLEMIWDESFEKRPDKYTFPYKSVTLTELGKELLPIIFELRDAMHWHEMNPYFTKELGNRLHDFYKKYESPFGDDDLFGRAIDATLHAKEEKAEKEEEQFITAFLDFLPDLKVEKHWYPIERERINGVIRLRIALDKKLYRDVAISAEISLEDLHQVIQEVYEFDDDHLFTFYMNNDRDENHIYSDTRAYSGYGLPASIIQLGELGLYEGKQFGYLFDFGDNWQFQITVLEIDKQAKELQHFELLKSVGESPEQYPDYEEEDW